MLMLHRRSWLRIVLFEERLYIARWIHKTHIIHINHMILAQSYSFDLIVIPSPLTFGSLLNERDIITAWV